MGFRALRCLVAAGLAACSFKGSAVDSDAARVTDAAVDAPGTLPTVDASLDAPPGPPPITAAQQCSAVNTTAPGTTIACMLPGPQSIGNTNIVIIDWGGTTAFLTSLTDTAGNIYVTSGLVGTSDVTSVLYYATITHAGPNRVMATISAPATNPKVRVFEYAGLSPTTPFIMGAVASGVGDTPMVGPVATSAAHSLMLAAVRPQHTTTARPPFVARDTSDGDLVEDEEVFAAASVSASAMQTPSGTWVMLLAAFRGM